MNSQKAFGSIMYLVSIATSIVGGAINFIEGVFYLESITIPILFLVAGILLSVLPSKEDVKNIIDGTKKENDSQKDN